MNPSIAPGHPVKSSIFGVSTRLQISERLLLLRTVDQLLTATSAVGALTLWAYLGGFEVGWPLLRDQSLWMALVVFGWFIWLVLTDMYDLRLAVKLGASTWRILAGSIVLTFVYLAIFFLTSRTTVTNFLPGILDFASQDEPLRLAPGVAIAASTFLLLVWRTIYVFFLTGPRTWPRLLILGAGHAGTALCQTVRQNPGLHYQITGFIDDDSHKHDTMVAGSPVLGGHDQINAILNTYGVDEIVVAISTELRGSIFQMLMYCHEQGITITPMPLMYERLTGRVAVEHIGSQWYVALPLQKHAAGTALRIIKRILDLAGGLILGSIFLLALPFVALAIRLDTHGPIFYRQERIGLYGRRFSVYKFRSMVQDAEADGEAQWAARQDPRITRVGNIMRKLRLDELPQILNVLKGDMSLVGPRPERQQFIEQLQSQIPFYRTRLAAKPGLTGWAQINYGYGSSVEDAMIKLQYDLYYLKHQTPLFDLLILLRTISVVLRMQGQ